MKKHHEIMSLHVYQPALLLFKQMQGIDANKTVCEPETFCFDQLSTWLVLSTSSRTICCNYSSHYFTVFQDVCINYLFVEHKIPNAAPDQLMARNLDTGEFCRVDLIAAGE